jgi:general secretion pathway protein J
VKSIRQLGFTLIEILIALFIFSIVSTIMVSALHTLFSSQINTEKRAARFAQLQITLTLLSNDLEQIIDRSITTSSGNVENAVVGGNSRITFTHAGFINPLSEALRSTLQRTDYHLEKQTLIRTSWPELDQTSQTLPNQRALLTDISQLQLDYLDKEGHFQNHWPAGDQSNSDELPRAIRVTLTLKDLGKISQTYVVPGQKIDKPN